MRSLVLLVLLAGGAGVAVGLPGVDGTRTRRGLDHALVFVPDDREFKLAATGFEEPLADMLWVRAILLFGERWNVDEDPAWQKWLATVILAINTLDPRWRTSYYYGGTLLRVLGDIEASDEVFSRGVEAMPHEWYFPFSLGMNAFLFRDDAATGADWLTRAATIDGAPAWVSASAAELRQRGGDRPSAIRYLKGVIQTARTPEVRTDAERQLNRLLHNHLVEGWVEVCLAYQQREGHAVASPSVLAKELGHPLPDNPRGDPWVVGADGVVRGAGAERERVRRARMAEFGLLR